jgi:hypothetical protein
MFDLRQRMERSLKRVPRRWLRLGKDEVEEVQRDRIVFVCSDYEGYFQGIAVGRWRKRKRRFFQVLRRM